MKETKVIKNRQLPTRLPVISTLVTILALDRWNAPEWAWAVFFTLAAIIWAAATAVIWKQKQVDVKELTDENSN